MIEHKGWWIPEIAPGGKSGIQPDRNLDIIALALEHAQGRDLVLQAGGFFGQWPLALSSIFGEVVAVEGDRENYECAVRNLGERAVINVTLTHAILGEQSGAGRMVHHVLLSGAHHASFDGGEVPVITIDSLGLTPDLIMLDIEGSEVMALKGAVETLRRCNSPIVLEDNRSRENFNLPVGHQQRFMATIGYKPVARHVKDLVYVRE